MKVVGSKQLENFHLKKNTLKGSYKVAETRTCFLVMPLYLYNDIISIALLGVKGSNQLKGFFLLKKIQPVEGKLQPLGILAHRTSDDEIGVYNHLQNGRYLGSITILSFGDPGSLGNRKFNQKHLVNKYGQWKSVIFQ